MANENNNNSNQNEVNKANTTALLFMGSNSSGSLGAFGTNAFVPPFALFGFNEDEQDLRK